MSRLHRSIFASLLVATGAFADLAIKIPNVVVKNDTAKVHAMTSIVANLEEAGVGSSFNLSLADSAVEFSYAVTAGAGEFKGAATLFVPLDPTWGYHDISVADSIYFEIKTDVPGTQVNVLIGAPHLDSMFANPKAALQSNLEQFGGFQKTVKPVDGLYNGVVLPKDSWQRVGMRFSDFVISPWYTSSADFDDLIANASMWNGAEAPGLNIGSGVQSIQFQPLWDWTEFGKIIQNGTANFYVRKIVIKRNSIQPPKMNCPSNMPHFQLDQFDSAKARNINTLGGYWYAYTDSSSPKPVDSMMGASTLDFLAGKAWAPWVISNVGLGAVRATLEKNVAGKYHKGAGWARLETNFGIDDCGFNIDYSLPREGMTSISFELYLGDAGGILPDSLKWDPQKIPYISLRVGVKGVPDSVAYAAKIPVDQGLGNKVCVDLETLAQPETYGNSLPWDPTYQLTGLALEAKIVDQSNPTTHSVGPVTFAIRNVNIYGISLDAALSSGIPARTLWSDGSCRGGGIKSSGYSARSLRATYSSGLTISYTLPGATAQLDILRLDGSRVARLQVPASATNLHLSQTLARGTYMLALRGEGVTQVAPLTVAR